jgi:hypothetical protein
MLPRGWSILLPRPFTRTFRFRQVDQLDKTEARLLIGVLKTDTLEGIRVDET